MSIIRPKGFDSEEDTIEVDARHDQICLDVMVRYNAETVATALTFLTKEDALNLAEALLDAIDIIDPPSEVAP